MERPAAIVQAAIVQARWIRYRDRDRPVASVAAIAIALPVVDSVTVRAATRTGPVLSAVAIGTAQRMVASVTGIEPA